jgi:NTP pyrophosphatase (non-canonical NTP hydrolase)
MRLSDKPTWKQQLLSITMEECGELTQACSKVLRFGFEPEKVDDLAREAGDVLCMIDRIPIKRNKLKIYSDILK